MTSVSDVLRKAAEIHAERGGCKGQLRTADGKVCLWGAVLSVPEVHEQAGHLFMGEYVEAISRIFQARFQETNSMSGIKFNDDPSTTDLDVEKFLLRTADEIEFTS